MFKNFVALNLVPLIQSVPDDPFPGVSNQSKLDLWRAFYTKELQSCKVPLAHSGMALAHQAWLSELYT